MKIQFDRLFGLLIVLVFSLSPVSVSQSAGTWYVSTSGSDSNPCNSPAAPCATINGAIAKASSGDTIDVAIGTYTGTGDEVVLLDKSLTLSGGWDLVFTSQPSLATIDSENLRRGVTVVSSVSVTMERFQVQNGINPLHTCIGGICNQGQLTLRHCIVINNPGGGIYSGIQSSLTIENTSVTSNLDGGITIFMGNLQIYNSTISLNMRVGMGGGIYVYGDYSNHATLKLTNSTVSGNNASDNGGGIYTIWTRSDINNSTITDNSSYTVGGYWTYLETTTVANSIIAGNHASTTPDCTGDITSGGYNLIGDSTNCGFTPGVGDLIGVDPQLGLLIGIPGEPKYHPLLPGSQAIDAGDPTGCKDPYGNILGTDQRGAARFGRCDIGAYELQPIGYSSKLADRQTAHLGEVISYTITLDNPALVEMANVKMTDALSDYLEYMDGSLTASKDQATYQNGLISWEGTLSTQEQVTVTFDAIVDELAPLNQFITNTAEIQGSGETFLRNAVTLIEPYWVYCPLIHKSCLPLYSDDFSNPASGWPVEDNGNNRYEYLDGEYRIMVRPIQSGALARPGFQALDYIVSVDLRNSNGVDGSYGIAFGIGTDLSTFYTLEIYPTGWYGLYRYDPNDVITLSEAFSSAIYQGNAINHIKVERNGASINAFANDQLLASVTDGTYTGSLYLGLAVFSYDQPNIDIRFDNFAVYPTDCGGLYSPLNTTNGLLTSPGWVYLNFDSVEKGHANHQK